MAVRITVEDLDSGKVETTEITNDYVLICAGNHYLDRFTRYKNGTVNLTIKVDKGDFK